MLRSYIFILTFVATLSCGVVLTARESDADLEKMLADVCRKHNVPSLTVAVVRADEIVATVCTGIRKRGTDDAVELSDCHPIGSNAKSMTAVLAAIVVESGKIDWDTTISEVWPKAGEKHLHPSLRDVTLDELLSHQSGIATDLGPRSKDWETFFKEKEKPAAERRRMLKMVLKKKPEKPRGKYHYSNLGYVVVAAMLEKTTGEDYETMVRRDIFKPLKMDSAEFRTMASARKLRPPLLWGHKSNGDPISPKVVKAENPSVYASAGTVHVSIADYAKYVQWHLRGQPAPLLSTQQALDHLHTGQIDRPAGGGKYGGGWIHLGSMLTHAGSNTNSYALTWILPDNDFAAIACTNTGQQSAFAACDEAIQELMKRYAR